MKSIFFSKVIWLIITSIFITNLILAQVGIRAGVLISRQDFQNGVFDADIKSKLGADIALVTEFPKGSPVRIGPEFHWMQKGAKIEDLNGSFGENARTFNYLEIPVLLSFHLPGIYFFGGPSAGYLLDGKDKDMDGNTHDIDLDFYRRAEFGAHIGGGIALGPLRADIRYIAGLTNILDDDTPLKVLNRGFGAGVSFMF